MLQLISWLLLGALHALPAFAFFRPASLTVLYGIGPEDPLFLLLQHRAALFLAVLIVCLWAAFDPSIRKVCTVVVALSMLSFLWLYFANGSPVGLKQIAVADMIGLPVLAVVAWSAFKPVLY